LLLCDECGYSANRQIAPFQKQAAEQEDLLEIKKVATPECKTIAELAQFLEIPESKTAKAVFLIATVPEGTTTMEKFVFAILRGDMELNETKLVNALKAKELRPATEEEIEAIGAVPGYASPVGLPEKNDYLPVVTIMDDLIPESTNLVAGANDAGYHLLNVNYGRDYRAEIITDIAAAQDGDLCIQCGNPLRTVRGVEVGNIFKLGTRYSDSLGCTFQDKDGKEKPIIMGSYGIGSGRLLASVAEEHNDDWGLIWPITIAPYHVHLVMLLGKNDGGAVEEAATKLYKALLAQGVEVLFDDRADSPGVKFNDADLIGLPIRVTVGDRNLKNDQVEIKRRDQDKSQKRLVSLDKIVDEVISDMNILFDEVAAMVVEVPYEE